MKFYCISIKSKATLSVLLSLVIVLLFSIEIVNAKSNIGIPILTNEDRINCINVLGYEVLPEVVDEKQIVIPNDFSDVYLRYNELQQMSGFNLKNYSGMEATIYKYKIKDSSQEKYVNIIICDGVLIGGDVSVALINGEMQPL